MPTSHCFIPILGKRIRVTQLDSCGNVYDGAQQISTDGFITVTLSSEVEDGNEIIVKKANGALCVNEKQADSFKRFTVEIDFCGVNPALLAMVTNAEPYVDSSGDTVGFTVPEGEINKWFSLEIWTGMTGAACAPGADEASGYMLLPLVVAGVLDDVEIGGEDAITFSLTGGSTKGGNNWGDGPYDVVKDEDGAPAKLDPGVDPFDHLLMIDTALAPPPDSCDPQPVGGGTPTGVTEGTPGAFIPAGSVPSDLAALNDAGSLGQSATAWAEGSYVVLGDNSHAYWTGTAWAVGEAPAP
jgi:hypothetical protein